MLGALWGIFGAVAGSVYLGLQGMFPCLPPAPLSSSELTSDQYLGSWHFLAAAAWDEDGISSLKDTDTSLLQIERGAESNLLVTETSTIGTKCQKSVWTYSPTGSFLFREDFDAFAVVWDGKWVNCSSCIVVFMIGEDDEPTFLLFTRDETTPEEAMQEFESKMECILMEDQYKAPRKQGVCKPAKAA